MSIVWKVLGERELKAALKSSTIGAAEMKRIHAEAAKIVLDAAKPAVPRRTGALLASGRSSGTKYSGRARFGGTSKVDYDRYVHFGVPSKHMLPQPFLYDAADHRRRAVFEVFAGAVAKRLADVDLD